MTTLGKQQIAPNKPAEYPKIHALTRILHLGRDEEVAKPDERKQAKILMQRSMSTYCPNQNQRLTQYSSDFPASSVDQQIFGLNPMPVKKSE